MKAITVKQPWASLICSGIKDIENRTWKTKFRGRVLIHAASVPVVKQSHIQFKNALDCLTHEQYLNLGDKETRIKLNNFRIYPLSKIIGSVEIVDCVLNHESIWAEHKATVQRKIKGEKIMLEVPVYNWALANPILFPEPILVKGKLSFWDYPNILAEPEEKDGELFCHCQLPVKEINQVTGGCVDYRCRYCGEKWYK